MASIRETRPGTWVVTSCVGHRADGKQRRRSRTVHGTRVDAEACAAALDAEMGANRAMGSGITIGAWFGQYLRSHALDPSTAANYRDIWRVHVAPRFGSRELCDPPAAEIQAWANSMSRGSAVHAVKLLRAVLRDAWYMGLLPSEPMRRPVRYPDPDNGKLDVWSANEALDALSRLHGYSIEACVLLMLGAGLRRSEACAVRWSDVERMDGITRIRIDKGARRDDGRTKNVSSIRYVAMPEPFGARLEELRRDGAVVRIEGKTCARYWQRAFKEGPLAGMRYIQMKNLRHTNASLMHEAGVSDVANSQYHGHADLRTDYRHYLSPEGAAVDGAAVKLSAYLSAKTADGAQTCEWRIVS